jgi:peptidoglycan/xylan/chitin deacetylase (PgdA/CDA1 family)
MKRRTFLASLTALPFTACTPAVVTKKRPRIAVTMDDFDLGFDKVLSPRERNSRILEALAKHNHKAAGFVTGRFVDNSLGKKVVQSWSDAGHLIGNHTYSHLNSSEEDPEVIKLDILKNHDFLSQFDGYEKIFRFPFLAEGGSPEKIGIYRQFLKENGFQPAVVTVGSIDWYTTSRLESRLKDNPNADTRGYRDYYIQTVLDKAQHFQTLAEILGFQELPHALLVHHNILNSFYLDDVLTALKSSGWDLIDAKEAFQDPFYRLEPATPTNGRSLLSVIAQERGYDNISIPKRYEGFGKKTMDALGL